MVNQTLPQHSRRIPVRCARFYGLGTLFLSLLILVHSHKKQTLPTTNPNTPDVANVQYGIADGQKLMMDVYLPVPEEVNATSAAKLSTPTLSTEKYPAIVFIHGGGWSGGNKSSYAGDCRWFSRHGYVCFTINYRLVSNGRNIWPAQLDDCQLAIRWVRSHSRHYHIDPAKIAAIGGSAGAHLVEMLAMRDTRATGTMEFPSESSRIECGVEMAGPSNLEGDFTKAGPFGPTLQNLVDGLVGARSSTVPDRIHDASPINFVTSSTAPLLIFQGDADPIVAPDQSVKLQNALQKAGAESRLIILKGEVHGLNPENHQRFRSESLQFLNRHFAQPSNP